MTEPITLAEGFTLPQIDLDSIADYLSADVQRLRGARVLITGGTGFFGAWLTESLLYTAKKCGFTIELDLVSRSPAAFAERMPHLAALDAVRIIEGDVRNLDIGHDLAYDYIIHAATESGGAQKSHTRLDMADTIVNGARNVLKIARDSGAKSTLYVSSGAVYGRRPPIDRAELDESYPGGPLLTDADIDHDESKRMAEALCRIFFLDSGVRVKIARCFAFIGPYLPLDSHFAAGNFIRDSLEGKEIFVRGDGTAVRTYMYCSDLVRWLVRILLDGEAAEAYNVAGNEPISVLGLAQYAASCANPAVPVRVLGRPGSSVSRIVASTQRAAKELGLLQSVGVSEALHRTMEWHRRRMSA